MSPSAVAMVRDNCRALRTLLHRESRRVHPVAPSHRQFGVGGEESGVKRGRLFLGEVIFIEHHT